MWQKVERSALLGSQNREMTLVQRGYLLFPKCSTRTEDCSVYESDWLVLEASLESARRTEQRGVHWPQCIGSAGDIVRELLPDVQGSRLTQPVIELDEHWVRDDQLLRGFLKK